MGCKSEVPTTPSSSSINLLELLTELKKPVYLLDYWLIIKGFKSRTAGWKRCKRQVYGKMHGAAMPFPSSHPPSTSTCSPTQKLPQPRPLGFLWRPPTQPTAIKPLATGDGAQSPAPLLFLGGGVGGAESSNPLIMAASPCNQPSSLGFLGAFQK